MIGSMQSQSQWQGLVNGALGRGEALKLVFYCDLRDIRILGTADNAPGNPEKSRLIYHSGY